MPLSLAFKGRGSTIGFQRERVHYCFQRGSPLSKCVYLQYIALSPVLTKKRVSDHGIILYFFGEYLENHEYRVDHDPCSRLNLFKSHNICIRYFRLGLRVCIVLYFSTLKLIKVLQCSRCVIVMYLCKIYIVHVCKMLFKISLF
jgi:hypothetical protein